MKLGFFNISAKTLVERTGANLVGSEVWTPKFGDWPGGWATVTEIAPDPAAPQIAFNVKSEKNGEIGIFEDKIIDYVHLAQ